MHSGAKILLMAGMVAMLWGCAGQPLQPTAALDGRIEGRGFAITAPQGSGWYVAKRSPTETVFVKASEETAQRGSGAAVTTAALGVRTLPADRLAALGGTDFTAGVERRLADRLGGPPAFYAGSPLLALEQLATEAYRLNNAVCAKYAALQIARPGLQFREPQLGFADHGFVCRHPHDPNTLVQLFFNERYVRELPRMASPATWDQVNQTFASLAFTAPR